MQVLSFTTEVHTIFSISQKKSEKIRSPNAKKNCNINLIFLDTQKITLS